MPRIITPPLSKKIPQFSKPDNRNPRITFHSTLRLHSGLRLIRGRLFWAKGVLHAGLSLNNLIYTKLAAFPSRKISRMPPFSTPSNKIVNRNHHSPSYEHRATSIEIRFTDHDPQATIQPITNSQFQIPIPYLILIYIYAHSPFD